MTKVAVGRIRTAASLARLTLLYGFIGALKHVVPLRDLVQWAGRRTTPPSRSRSLDEIVGRVLQAGRWSGTPDRDCVQRSVLLYRELSRAGRHPHLVMGVSGSAGARRGHAWVTLDGAVVAEAEAGVARFAPLVEFDERGYWMRPINASTAESPSAGSSSTN